MDYEVTVEVSARHVHLTKEQVEILFGAGHELTPDKWLSQPGQFLAKERVNLTGPKKKILRVAVLGPVRSAGQVELSLTDCYAFGIPGVLRESGHVEGTPGMKLYTDLGEVELDCGVIVAQRHIHMTPQDAERLQVRDRQTVRVKLTDHPGRNLIFEDVLIRVSDQFSLAMHIDTDEANAAFISGTGRGVILTGTAEA